MILTFPPSSPTIGGDARYDSHDGLSCLYTSCPLTYVTSVLPIQAYVCADDGGGGLLPKASCTVTTPILWSVPPENLQLQTVLSNFIRKSFDPCDVLQITGFL